MYLQAIYSAKVALVVTLTVALLGFASFFMFEPAVSRAVADTDQFIVTQSITGEISFQTPTADVTMSPAIPGLTGGVSSGTTTVVVLTNNPSGYNMTIEFSSSTAMIGNSQGGVINDYTPTDSEVPDFTFGIGGSGTPGEFAYSVGADIPADLDPTFQDNGATCGGGGNSTTGNCWYNASSSAGTPIAEPIVNRTTETLSTGATTTIFFKVSVPSNPSPVLPIDTYTATATLTATTN